MRLLIAGWRGQLARALVEAAPACADVEAFAVGRPALDLKNPGTVARAIADVRPDVIINSAAYTAVDQAEREPDAARMLNCEGARVLAEMATRCSAAIIHISTDYVFDGSSGSRYVETDATAPVNVYGRSKLEGEAAVRACNPRHLIVRTSWVHSPFGQNFVKSMLRLAGERAELRVVDDQIGSPTYAPHLAEAVLNMARRVSRAGAQEGIWGTYHAAGSGAVSWCGLAREVCRVSASLGGPSAPVVAITTADYPTAARRPANSRLDCSKLEHAFGLRLPDWHIGVAECVRRLLGEQRMSKSPDTTT